MILSNRAMLSCFVASSNRAWSCVCTQVEKLNLLQPGQARGYLYASLSMGLSLILGIVGYGGAVWTL